MSWVTTSRTASVGWGGPSDTAVLYGPEDVVADLDGLETVKAERVRRPVPTDDGEKIAIDVLVRATRPQRGRPMTDAGHGAEAGAVRASASLSTSRADIDRLIESVSAIAGGSPAPVSYHQDEHTGDFWPDSGLGGWTADDRARGASCAHG